MPLDRTEITTFLLAVTVLLLLARVMGEVARRLNQPAILGEIIAGLLLGPTVFGRLFPETQAMLFPKEGDVWVAMHAITTLAVVLFLMVAGMEVDLSTIWRQGRAAIAVSVSGIVVPFVLGFGLAFLAPGVLGRTPDEVPLVFALFFATALSISALPVIAKTLMDLSLYRTEFGVIVIAAAVFDDLAGWLIFGVILGMMHMGDHGPGVGHTMLFTLGYAAFMLTVGRWLIHWLLPLVKAHTSWPGGVLGFCMIVTLMGAAFTEYIGVHAIFGAFLAGVALGDSHHLREETRATLDRFISFIFAPLFFATLGLRVDFIANFDLSRVLAVLIIGCVGKVVGCGVGARVGGMGWRQAWAIGFAMNARGAMEIILGVLALEAGVIRQRMFVALVVLALVTSIMSGPAIQAVLRRRKAPRLMQYVTGRGFMPQLQAADRDAALAELSEAAARVTGLDAAAITHAVRRREETMSTGLSNGLAMPHARLEGVASPVVVVGLSHDGIDFDASDGKPVHVLILLLTPIHDHETQLQLVADVARTFSRGETTELASHAKSVTEFLAVLNSQPGALRDAQPA